AARATTTPPAPQPHGAPGSYEPVDETGSASELVNPAPAAPSAPVTEDAVVVDEDPLAGAPEVKSAKTSAELLEQLTGTAVDSPLCLTCGTKMRPAGSCYVCEGCGSTSGCS
ncbi:MAG: hypothetical protein L0H31_08945, partial [Nocardioidaceae bacterium]|nr:hypothetical protein [Nocardioidaceae bacterium]